MGQTTSREVFMIDSLQSAVNVWDMTLGTLEMSRLRRLSRDVKGYQATSRGCQVLSRSRGRQAISMIASPWSLAPVISKLKDRDQQDSPKPLIGNTMTMSDISNAGLALNIRCQECKRLRFSSVQPRAVPQCIRYSEVSRLASTSILCVSYQLLVSHLPASFYT